jgi:hypothetical protein
MFVCVQFNAYRRFLLLEQKFRSCSIIFVVKVWFLTFSLDFYQRVEIEIYDVIEVENATKFALGF